MRQLATNRSCRAAFRKYHGEIAEGLRGEVFFRAHYLLWIDGRFRRRCDGRVRMVSEPNETGDDNHAAGYEAERNAGQRWKRLTDLHM